MTCTPGQGRDLAPVRRDPPAEPSGGRPAGAGPGRRRATAPEPAPDRSSARSSGRRRRTLALGCGSRRGEPSSAQVPDDLPAVQADPDRVSQVLRNLLVNALAPHARRRLGHGDATAGQRHRRVAVADTGEGIAPEDLPHIFERFWRADRARTRDNRVAGSTGLGLSVAQSLVEAQGGRIWAESSARPG